MENGFLADPAGDNLDTGTAAVTLQYPVLGKASDVFFRVANTSVHAITVTVNAGANPPAMRAGIGPFVGAPLAAGAVGWYGPFDSGQFIQSGANAGNLSVTWTPSGGDTVSGKITAFAKPKAS